MECLYWSLMNGWDIPKDIREHYGFSEDYELYHRLESMEPEDYRERRLRGEIPDAVEVDVRLTHAVEKVFERLCSPPPVQYLDKLYGELEKLGGFIANPKNIDSPFINSGFLMKYGIDRNSPDEIRRQQAEKAYKELYARFETMVGLKSPNKKDDNAIRKECRQPACKERLSGKARIPVSPKPKRRKMGL
ncbi:hypothetical protein F2Z07_27650 [Phocaeicola dorei]|uniref:Uncharacterized protein n=1 Tax=Phocaeicola dorei TaxID=357276 RepID=A0A6L3IID6_9BACT|nr:hypothetical protein F2Z07_27650 [Phocaeicola dorei]